MTHHNKRSPEVRPGELAPGAPSGRAQSAQPRRVYPRSRGNLETGICYSASLDYLLEHGFRRDFGHGPQVFLPRSQWSRSGAGQLQLLTH